MENGAVYSPTTEAAPGAGRGTRSGLAAYFFLGRLPWYRRILKGLQLVSRRRRRPGPVGWGGCLEAAARPPRSGSSRFHTPGPSLPTRLGGIAVRLLPVARPQPPRPLFPSLS